VIRSRALTAVSEFFFLRGARSVVASTPVAKREAIGRALRLSRQRSTAASSLWSAGHQAEALRLLSQAVEDAIVASREHDPAASDADLSALLAEAEALFDEAALPALDADVAPAHAELFRRAAQVRNEIDRRLAPASRTLNELTWMAVLRWLTAGALLALSVVALYLVSRTPKTAVVRASAELAGFPAANVADGQDATEWLLPNGGLGWIELQLAPSRDVRELRLVNAHNPPYNDRATKSYRIEIYSGERRVKSVQGAFPRFSTSPEPRTVAIGASNVDRIRFQVLSFHLAGGGLAEISDE